jgi:hypothetical protein
MIFTLGGAGGVGDPNMLDCPQKKIVKFFQ